MAITQNTITLNEFGLQRRERTSSSGTATRYTVSIEADPLVHTFDSKMLGAGPALAIAEHLRQRVQAIGADAKPATQLARKYAATGVAAGKPWATRRYDGGKLGAMAPNTSPRLFNDSGRFARSIIAGPTSDNNWVINVAANRFDPSTFTGGEAGIEKIFNQLRSLIPEFGDANALAYVATVRDAISDSLDMIFMNNLGGSYSGRRDLRAEVRRGQLEAIRKAIELYAELAG